MLIADDHQQITQVLEAYAKKEGFDTVVAHDGAQALAIATTDMPDIILLDVMMPKMDGFEVCRRIRAFSTVPILLITARGEDFERIMGLDIGADDYIVKPFSPGEVMARVRAVLRRAEVGQAPQTEGILRGKLLLNMDTADVTVDGQAIALTKKEMDLLYTLADKPGRIFTREQLLNSLWGYDYFGDSRTVDSHIKRLRAKLDVTDKPGFLIRTVWGRGYQFEVSDDEA